MKFRSLILLLFLSFSAKGQVLDTTRVLDTTGLQARVDSLLALSSSLADSSNFDQALEFVGKAQVESLKYTGKESVSYATICYYYGAIYAAQGDYVRGEQYLQESIFIHRKLPRVGHPQYARAMGRLGALYTWNTNQWLEAEALLAEAIEIFEEVADSSFIEDLLSAQRSLMFVWYNLGKYDEAESLLLETLDFYEQRNEKESIGYALALSYLGTLNLHLCAFQKAEIFYQECYKIAEKIVPNEEFNFIRRASIGNLARLYIHMGNFNKAETLLLESREISNALEADQILIDLLDASLLSNLYTQFGQFEKAENIHLESLRKLEEHGGNQNPEYDTYLNNLAFFYRDMGDRRRSNVLFQEICDLYEKKGDTDDPEYASSLLDLANSMLDLKNYQEAKSLYLQALEINKKAIGKMNYFSTYCLRGLAEISIAQSDYQQAEFYYLDAISIILHTLGKESTIYFSILSCLVDLYQKFGYYEKALPLFKETENGIQTYLERAKIYMSSTELSQYLDKLSEDRNRVFSFLYEIERPNSNEERDISEIEKICYNHTLYDKGFLLQTGNELKKLMITDSTAQTKFERMVSRQRLLAKSYSLPIDERKNVEALEDEINAIEKDLALTVAGYKDASRQVLWSDVRDALEPNEAAIEFIHWKADKKEGGDTIHYSALVIRKEWESPKYVYLFQEDQVSSFSDNGALNPIDFHSKLDKYDIPLIDLIWTPLDTFFHLGDRIYFSPTGILNRIPLTALQNAAGYFMGDAYEMHQISSTRQLVDKPSSKIVRSDSTWTGCVFGGINYDLNDASTVLTYNTLIGNDNQLENMLLKDTRSFLPGSSNGWEYLPWTEVEAKTVTTILKRSGVNTSLFVNHQASEENFRYLGIRARSPHVLHIATHGYFFPEPNKSDQNSASMREPIFKMSEHPLIRSGLIMAGANHVWTGGKPFENLEDGILTAYEVSQMDLSNTELVVLSACETGLGDIKGNEGVYGLQRAFKMAGAKNILMSLWQVPDFATQELMTLFYTNWIQEEMDLPEAFRKAQATIRAKRPDPFYWAGFVLVE